MVDGRIRNRLDEVLTVTDEAGRFAIFPPKDGPFSLIALHPHSGMALIDGEQFRSDPKMALLKWGGIVAEFSEEPEPQQASLYTRLEATTSRPRISFAQYWSDRKRHAPTLTFEFTRVPLIWETSIMRSFPGAEGTTHSLPGASVGVLPGETRKIALGSVTPQ